MTGEGGGVDRDDDERRGFSHAFSKKWYRGFCEDRDFKDDRPWHTDYPRAEELPQNPISTFLQSDEDSFSPYRVEDIGEFCGDAKLSDLQEANSQQEPEQARAWIDSRSRARNGVGEQVRGTFGPLGAAELHRHLIEKVRIIKSDLS